MSKCNSCPFNCTEEAEYAQNMGCLPSAKDIIEIKETTGNNWACHTNNKRACEGLKEAGYNTEEGKLHLQPAVNADFISWEEKDVKPYLQ